MPGTVGWTCVHTALLSQEDQPTAQLATDIYHSGHRHSTYLNFFNGFEYDPTPLAAMATGDLVVVNLQNQG